MTNGLLVVGGLVALIIGAEVLVRAGTGLASWLGIRPMMIGLTVVSLGTSVPVSLPQLTSPRVVFGLPNAGEFVTFVDSARNSSFILSVISNLRKIEKSRLPRPGPSCYTG